MAENEMTGRIAAAGEQESAGGARHLIDANKENFPVGSWLLPAALRPHIAKFYAFARAIDDIADNPDLAPDDKVRRLDEFEDAVTGRGADDPAYRTAYAMRESLDETGIPAAHCVDLITAFKLDATKLRYRDWDDLMGYCILSTLKSDKIPTKKTPKISGIFLLKM